MKMRADTILKKSNLIDIQVRELTTLAESESLEKLQQDIWGYGAAAGPPYPYPGRALFEFAESGGLVAGAFADGALIGFAAAWIGREKASRALYLHSQLVGVSQQYRNCGVGTTLKVYQRQFAERTGLQKIKWTFDPLQTRNGYLNLRKLGVVVRVFIPNYYGQLGGTQNCGLATDRFWAEWDVPNDSDNHISREEAWSLPVINKVNRDGWPLCQQVDLHFSDLKFMVELPANMQEIRTANSELALHWQQKLHSVCTRYMPAYYVTDAIRLESRFFYIFQRADAVQI